jgi:hypothetical protein
MTFTIDFLSLGLGVVIGALAFAAFIAYASVNIWR